MLQTQLINLIPDPQGFTMRPPNKAAPSDCSGRFARMMQEISAASPGEISSLAKQPPEDIKTEEQPLPEQNPQLFLLALAPPIEQISSYIIQPSEHSYEQFE
ncbi:MAG: hypothetical protein FWF04_01835, partial [Clostridiales bacterium]|nr:hypothetical protein [Clostridiales bacterium]